MVNLIGEKVKHKTLGIGEIISVKENYITVKFVSKISTFKYPIAFENYLIPEDCKISDAVNIEVKIAKELEAKKKAEEEAGKVEEERQRQNMHQEKKNKKKANNPGKANGKYVVKKTRSKSLKYLVFQDEYYEEECEGQFILIRGIKKSSGVVNYRDPLFDVISGDIIFHCVKGYIRAVSIVKDIYFNSSSTDFTGENRVGSDNNNMRIDSEYYVLENPVKCDDNILNTLAHVDKDASKNKEYLFGLDNELVKRLLKCIFNRNSFMKNIIILHANLDGMPVIVSKEELYTNCKTLDKYIESRTDPEYSYALDLIKRGICFVAIQMNGEYKFYPSRFVGYQNNSRLKHMNNRWRDGRETNPEISYVLKVGEPLPDIELEVLYREYCERLGFEAMEKGSFGNDHKYWKVDK